MSIIQQIRDKAAWLVFGVIALSLLGFLAMDAFVGRGGGGMFGRRSTTIGSVNGSKIELSDFEKRKKGMEDQYRASGYPVNEMMQQNIQEQVWNQYVEENVLKDEYDKLGLDVSSKELDDMLFGDNPPQDLKQQFTNKETGMYDANALKSAINQLRKQKNDPRAEQFEAEYLPSLINSRLKEKYTVLLANTTYIPKWMIEKTNADQTALAAVSYVNVPYSSISDSTIKVSDDEVSSYVNKHKDEFKQPESRGISYVLFDAAPSRADSQALFNQLTQLKGQFASATEIPAFLVQNGSETNYFDGYVLKSKMQVPNADTLRSLADGTVYGPYLDGSNYVLAKMIGKRELPDSVKCRHILISTQAGLPDSTAKARIDSIAAAVKGGADFAKLCLQYSDDPGSKEKGGEYDFSSQQFGSLAKEFSETIFYGSTGDKKIVKTDFGYHYIEVLNQKNFEPAYKLAYLSKPINASEETQNTASGAANQFAGESRTAKAFEDNIVKRKYLKLPANDIKPIDNMIAGVGANRQLVQWIYGADKGDVSEPYDMGDKYVVAMVTEINDEGTMSATKARPQVEFIIRNEKKAQQLIKKMNGPASTLEAVSKAYGNPIMRTDSLGFAAPVIPNVGQEPKVTGAAFNKEWKGKVSPAITGNAGLFYIKTESISAKPLLNGNIDQQRTAMMQQMKSMGGYRSLEALKKAADVKDERSKLM
ncbi:MAG: SurA N-terminal domain-containing protein [Williamsia sp.]|nr:SurA N-terminal domain-containing protein [Williamsia sp.]